MIYYRKTLSSSGPKLTAVQRCAYEFGVSNINLDRLGLATEKYLKKIFEVENLGTEFDIEVLLSSYCKTPNGILKPKIETIREYQDFCIKFFTLLMQTLPTNLITLCALPAIRIKPSKEKADVEGRPYFTGKLHSDSWVGHTCDAILLLHLFGSEKNTVEFFDPIKYSDNFLDIASSFSEGILRVDELKRIGILRPKKMVLMDHACLHRTLTSENSGTRLSIDMGVYVEKFPQISHNCPITYYAFEELLNLGKSLNLTTEDSFLNEGRNGVTLKSFN